MPYYERRGRGAAGSPALVFLHGLGSCADDWAWQVPAFERDHRLLLVDLPGHYRSALPAGGLTVEGMADAVAALLARLGEPPAHVVGLSLGGCVALALALRAPARVRSLTVVNAFARLRPAGVAAAARMAARLALLATAPMSAVAAVVARGLFPRPEQAHLYAAAARSLGRTRRRAYLAGVQALARFDARAALARVTCPALIVAGAEDATVALDVKEALARAIPGARWALVPGAGHAANADHPDAFNATLRDFLAGH
jgi:pimeloyl-ACP methyl ester carboxylesterase